MCTFVGGEREKGRGESLTATGMLEVITCSWMEYGTAGSALEISMPIVQTSARPPTQISLFKAPCN